MPNPKAEALAQLQAMPDDLTWDQILYRLYVRAAVERGMADIEAGKGISHEQVTQEIEQWLASSGALMPASNNSVT